MKIWKYYNQQHIAVSFYTCVSEKVNWMLKLRYIICDSGKLFFISIYIFLKVFERDPLSRSQQMIRNSIFLQWRYACTYHLACVCITYLWAIGWYNHYQYPNQTPRILYKFRLCNKQTNQKSISQLDGIISVFSSFLNLSQ